MLSAWDIDSIEVLICIRGSTFIYRRNTELFKLLSLQLKTIAKLMDPYFSPEEETTYAVSYTHLTLPTIYSV